MDGCRLVKCQVLAFTLFAFLLGSPAHAKKGESRGIFEISALIAYSQSKFDEKTYSRQNRYTGEFAWHFTSVSAIEFSYSRSYTKIAQTVTTSSLLFPTITESVTYDDTVYGASWVQGLLPADFLLMPYFKVGAGRMVRKQKVEYSALVNTQEFSQKADTGVAGAGVKITLTKSFSVKGELVSYMPNFKLSTWRDSEMFSVGLSWMF